MKPPKRSVSYLFFFAVLLAAFLPLHAVRANARSVATNLPSPSEVITAINNYRQQNGIPPLTDNSLLSSLAQGQSDYQSAISSITHSGAGGTTPQQRAANAGYGGGSFFYLSEIIYGGYQASSSDALSWWKNSGLHNSIMLDAKYTEIGAGVSTDGTMIYFAAELGGPTGGSSSSEGGAETTRESNPEEGNNPPTTQLAPFSIPVVKATPAADGSITHIVQQGQSPWTIAAIYEINLDLLLSQNGLTKYSIVSPGDELMVRPAPGLTATPNSSQPTTTLSPEDSPVGEYEKLLGTPFSLLAASATLSQAASSTPASTLAVQPVIQDGNLLDKNPMVSTLLIAAIAILILVIIFSVFAQQKPDRGTKDDLLE